MSIPFPMPDTEWEATREFWQAASENRLVIPRCSACQTWNWYPGEVCRACHDGSLSWTPVSGRGTLFSWALVDRAFVPAFAEEIPYLTGLVSLAEDPAVRLVTRLVDCEPGDLRMDLPMQVVYRPLRFPETPDEVMAPFFAPAI